MAVLAWVVVPAVAGPGGTTGFTVALIWALTIGLVWQFVLSVGLVAIEQRSLRFRVLRQALWLIQPTTPRGRRSGLLWLWLIPLIVGYVLVELIPFTGFPEVASHSFPAFLASTTGRTLLEGNWGLLGLITVMFTFNTFLGEELLFRGVLLPRMRGAFGRLDWLVNGLLFGAYHLHQPWSMLSGAIEGTVLLAYPTKRLHSAWIGIIVHSAQSVFLLAILVALVTS
jgi:CAAX protease family protein